MAQLERLQRPGDSESPLIHEPKKISTSTTHDPKKISTTHSPTMEHYLRGEGLRSSSTTSTPPSASSIGHHDQEDDHGHHQKKSVLTKVKEKAKKLRHSLSGKKKHIEGESTPSSMGGASMHEHEHEHAHEHEHEHEDEELDAEYLGAPMYESEQAPETYKETAKLKPRAVPVISEKHVLPNSVNPESQQAKEKPVSPNKIATKTAATKPLSAKEAVSPVSRKPPSPRTGTEKPASPRKTITETVTEKLGPAYATVSDTTHAIASKIESITVSAPAAVSDATHAIASKVGLNVAVPSPSEDNKALTHSVSTLSAPPTSREAPPTLAASGGVQPLSAPANPQSGSAFTSDKGVSVKEYLIQKFEPGEDERALSRVISDVMSPRRSHAAGGGGGGGGGDVGVVGKMKGAISSLLRNEEPLKTTASESAMPSSPSAQSSAMMTSSPNAPMTSSPRIPLSVNAYEVEAVEDENKGRRLQTN